MIREKDRWKIREPGSEKWWEKDTKREREMQRLVNLES